MQDEPETFGDLLIEGHVQPQYSFNGPLLPGIAKIVEEAGEVTQVFGKLLMTGGEQINFDGTDLLTELLKETADLAATLDFFQNYAVANMDQETYAAWLQRRRSKLDKFISYRTEEKARTGAWDYLMFQMTLEDEGFFEFQTFSEGSSHRKTITHQGREREIVVQIYHRQKPHTIGHRINGEFTTAPQEFSTYQEWVAAYRTECIRMDHDVYKGEE